MTAGGAAAVFTSVVVLAVAPGTVALTTFLQQRVGWTRRFQVNSVYTTVTLAVAFVGCLLWPALLGPGHGPGGLVGALAAGAVLAWPVTRVDAVLSRRLAALLARSGPERRPSPRRTGARVRTVPAGIAATTATAERTRTAARPAEIGYRRRRADGRYGHGLAWLLCVAVCEELLFRGALLGWASGLSPALAGLAACGATAVFLLLHSGFGWHQVAAKVPLAVATTALAVAFGTVWGAVLLHGLFNLWYWRRQSWLASSPVGTAATS